MFGIGKCVWDCLRGEVELFDGRFWLPKCEVYCKLDRGYSSWILWSSCFSLCCFSFWADFDFFVDLPEDTTTFRLLSFLEADFPLIETYFWFSLASNSGIVFSFVWDPTLKGDVYLKLVGCLVFSSASFKRFTYSLILVYLVGWLTRSTEMGVSAS